MSKRDDALEIINCLGFPGEVWIADFPDHMIHFNGDKFIGPYPHRTDEKRQ